MVLPPLTCRRLPSRMLSNVNKRVADATVAGLQPHKAAVVDRLYSHNAMPQYDTLWRPDAAPIWALGMQQ